MKSIYQPYSLDAAHLVPVSRIGNLPTTPHTTTTIRMDAPRIINATVTPSTRAGLLAESHTSARDRVELWADRAWNTVKALAALTVAVTVTALAWLTYLAVMAVIALVTTVIAWIGSHLFLIGAVIIGLLFLGSSTAACTGLHCGGCKG